MNFAPYATDRRPIQRGPADVIRTHRTLSAKKTEAKWFLCAALIAAQALWLTVFFSHVNQVYYKDIVAYQRLIDSFSGLLPTLDDFTVSAIVHRTKIYGEYMSSIVFQLSAHAGIGAVELQIGSICALTAVALFGRKMGVRARLAGYGTLVWPFIFGNLLLGNMRQLWALTLIVLFYRGKPLFGFFTIRKERTARMVVRMVLTMALIALVHIGSVFVFLLILICDYTNYAVEAVRSRGGDRTAGPLRRRVIAVAGVGLFVTFAYLFFGAAFQAKIDYYTGRSALHIYPYLKSAFFYLMIVPLVGAVFFVRPLRGSNPQNTRVAAMFVLVLVCANIVAPPATAAGVDRSVSSLCFLLFIARLEQFASGVELWLTSIRAVAGVYFVQTR
jgi:hypothetical protein